MLRRTFIAGAAGVAGAAAMPAAASSAGRAPFMTSYVADVAYHSTANGRAVPAPGTRLALRRAPENRFSPDTIEVWDGDRQLGNIPGRDARILAGMMDQGIPLRAAVSDVRHTQLRPEIKLALSLAS